MDIAAEAGFIHKLMENRTDNTTRLVYADWLDDREDPRAEVLREMVKGSQPMTGDEAEAMAERLRPLVAKMNPLLAATTGNDTFIHMDVSIDWIDRTHATLKFSVMTSADNFVEHGGKILRFLPFDSLMLSGIRDDNIAGCFAHPELALLKNFIPSSNQALQTWLPLREAFSAGRLRGLETMDVGFSPISGDQLREIFTNLPVQKLANIVISQLTDSADFNNMEMTRVRYFSTPEHYGAIRQKSLAEHAKADADSLPAH